MVNTLEQVYERLRLQCTTGEHPDQEVVYWYLTQGSYQPSEWEIKGWLLTKKIEAMSYYQSWLNLDSSSK